MGFGDEVLALGQAQEAAAFLGGPVAIVGADGRPRWSELWEGDPAVTRDLARARLRVTNGPNARPYIARWGTWEGGPVTVFTDWRARDHRARLRLSLEEQARGATYRLEAGPYVVIEPGVRTLRPHSTSNPNKAWPSSAYEVVIAAMPRLKFVQVGPAGTYPRLRGAHFVETPTFRAACAILAQATAYLGPEGGLHHAAAALRVPGVVIFGGHTDPETTGYPEHRNLYVPGPESPCGRWAQCQHCTAALSAIKPEQVAMHLAGVLAEADPDGRPPMVMEGAH